MSAKCPETRASNLNVNTPHPNAQDAGFRLKHSLSSGNKEKHSKRLTAFTN